MRSAPRWRAFIPTSREIRFAATRRFERMAPALCPMISLSTRQAEFETSAARGPSTLVEAAETPLPPRRIARFETDFEMELEREGRIPTTSRLELEYALFEDAWVFGNCGQVVDAGSNLSITPVSRRSAVPGILAARRLDGIAFSLITRRPGHRGNYHNFLTKRTPECLLALRAAVQEFGRLTILAPEIEHPLYSTLIDEVRRRFPYLPIRRVRKNEKIRCEGVVYHRVRRSSIFRCPASRRILSDTVEAMRSSSGVSPAAGPTRRLFVSRADAKKRRLLNEDEIFARLEGFGFERVTAGNLSFADQVELFSEAQIAAGPHGAGLTNAMFMPEGGAVVEIFRQGHVHGSFAWLSHLRGHFHAYVVSKETAPRQHYRLTGAGLNAFEREVKTALERISVQRSSAG